MKVREIDGELYLSADLIPARGLKQLISIETSDKRDAFR